MRSKNNTFRQVVSLEKSTFAHSEKWLNQGSERRSVPVTIGSDITEISWESKKPVLNKTFSNT